MNLLCPNCQNPVTVDEQFAGQLMKCPLCNQNFTVPALPQAAGALHETTPHPGAGGAHAEVYGVRPEEHAAPPPPPPPAFTASAPPSPPTTAVTAAGPAAAAAPVVSREGYHRTAAAVLNPQVLPWVAAGALFLVFVLSFFPWIGYYPGGHGVLTQSAWGAAFGGYTYDKLWGDKMTEYEKRPAEEKPGTSVWLVFFVLLLLPTVVVTAAAAALPGSRGRFKVPPAVERLEPWRWALAGGLLLLLLAFVLLQLLTGFNLETTTRATVAKGLEAKSKDAKSDEDVKTVEILSGQAYSSFAIHRTFYLRLAVVLLFVAVLAAGATHWLLQRGPGRPLPRMELMW